MASQKLHKTFEIVDNPWWRNQYASSSGVDELLERISYVSATIKTRIKVDDPYWVDYLKIHHANYLLQCINGECPYTTLIYSDVEKALNAGFLRKLWSFLFSKTKYRRMKKLKNLNHAVKTMFPKIRLFEPSPLEKLNMKFVKELHQQVGKGVIPDAGKFRTKDAKPTQENFFYLRPHLIEQSLESLLNECQQVFAEPDLALADCIKYAACFLSEFLFIHPFSSGNGRVARLLLSYLLIKYTVVPVSLHSSDSARVAYLQCLRETREFHSEYYKPASLSRFILENIEREFIDLHYLMDLHNV